MTRPLREKSSIGIYHVMLRGVNKQIIFEESDDYQKFIRLLRQSITPTDELGKPLPPQCSYFAYCLMPNHVHLIVKEQNECLSETVRRIATAYALYFNKKYERCGHLFQDRFKSEPVNDSTYFVTLLRYVHQNPVAGGLCQKVEDYAWSSWGEFLTTRRGTLCSAGTLWEVNADGRAVVPAARLQKPSGSRTESHRDIDSGICSGLCCARRPCR